LRDRGRRKTQEETGGVNAETGPPCTEKGVYKRKNSRRKKSKRNGPNKKTIQKKSVDKA